MTAPLPPGADRAIILGLIPTACGLGICTVCQGIIKIFSMGIQVSYLSAQRPLRCRRPDPMDEEPVTRGSAAGHPHRHPDATPPATPHAVSRLWRHLLDGERAWGSVDTWHARHGMTRHRLVVFPPGTNLAERRRLRLWRGWPLWGAALWIVSEVVLSNQLAPIPAVAASTSIYLLSGYCAFVMAGTPRTQIRVEVAITMSDLPDLGAEARRENIGRHAKLLVDADKRLATRHITAAEHEMIWSEVYRQLPAGKY